MQAVRGGKRYSLRFIGTLFVFAGLPLIMNGADLDEEEIRRLSQQVSEIAAKQAGILDSLELARTRVRLSERILARAKRERREARRAIEESRVRIGELQKKEEAALAYLATRIRHRYALGVMQDYRALFAASSTQDLKDAGIYLSALARSDKEQIRRFRALQKELAETRRRMEAQQDRLESVERNASEEHGILLEEKAALAKLLGKISHEQETARKALDESLQAARELNRYMEDLSFRTRIEMLSKNMLDRRGTLPYPLEGRVLHGFGDTIHPRFKTRVPHPGFDIEVPSDARVRAVFDGEAAYAGWLTGYGFTVILSHPGGYFTVYGQLKEVLIETGDVLSEGGILGTAGGTGTEPTPLYFELRRGGRAINPKSWLKRR